MIYLTNARNDSRKRKHATTSARPTTPVTWEDNSFALRMIFLIYMSCNLSLMQISNVNFIFKTSYCKAPWAMDMALYKSIIIIIII